MFPQPQGQPNGRLIAVAFVLGMAVYLAMILGPLAWLEQITGLKPFDMRPGGYSHEDARELIAALGSEGRHIYLWRQIPLDTAYPALFAITVAGAIRWFCRGMDGRAGGWFRAISFAAYIAAASDYVENILIVVMLNAGSDPSPSLTRAASAATLVKSTLTTVALTALLLAIILFVVRKVTRRDRPG